MIIKVWKIQKWNKYPPNYWLPWQHDSEDNVETHLEILPIKFWEKSCNLSFEF